MAAEVLIEMRSKFRGDYPELPISETALAGFEDADPVFLTLPIGKVGTTSRNGRYYDREAMQMLVDTINQETVVGQLGHLREDERAYRFDIPPVLWMSARMETDGTVWAKAYVMKHASAVREYVKAAKVTKGRVGTSLYGTAEVDEKGRVRNLQIESIDLAHPSRIGVAIAASVPAITAETDQTQGQSARLTPETASESTSRTTSESSEHPEGCETEGRSTTAPLSETQLVNTANPAEDEMATVQEMESQIIEMKRKHIEDIRALQSKLTENDHRLADYDRIVEMLGKPQDPILALQIQQRKINSLEGENAELLRENIAAQVAEKVRVDSVRPVIEQLVREQNPARRVDVTSALNKVLDQPHIKELLKYSVQETMGPAHERPAASVTHTTNEEESFFVYPEAK